jgi:hypothetical protein
VPTVSGEQPGEQLTLTWLRVALPRRVSPAADTHRHSPSAAEEGQSAAPEGHQMGWGIRAE